jgi:phosphoglucosamine mutase
MAGATHAGPLFGTDGIRAVPGEFPLDRATVVELGRCLAARLAASGGADAPTVVLGGDTRASTPQLCRWLLSGLEAGGARGQFVGVLPTPGVSFLTADLNAAAGIAVSASHNPFPDNGIKLLDSRGRKWSPEAEAALEAELLRRLAAAPDPAGLNPAGLNPAGAGPAGLNPAGAGPEVAGRYLDALAAQIEAAQIEAAQIEADQVQPVASEDGAPELPLAGLSVVVDCAHGAASDHAPALFRRLGAEVGVLFAAPDGHNINQDCGSTHPERLADSVYSVGADLGFAFDGDADRVIAVDDKGTVRNGDALLYLWARALRRAGRLDPPRVVATSMSNLGLTRALAREGIELVRCDVGDRAVALTMEREGIVLGGEQSGHLIHSGLAPTGDGLQTALHVAALVAASGASLSDLLEGFTQFPQILLNVRVSRKPDLLGLPAVAEAAHSVDQALGDRGRLVLRYSGTEPLARVMIEGEDGDEIEELARGLAEILEKELN